MNAERTLEARDRAPRAQPRKAHLRLQGAAQRHLRNRQLLLKSSAKGLGVGSSVVPGEEALNSVPNAAPVAYLPDASKLVTNDDLSYTPRRTLPLPGGRLGARSPVRSGARLMSPVRGSSLRK